MKIGFFDSGLGGLVAMNSVRNLLPQYDYVFFGDTANLPFGDKTEEEIFELTRDGIERLFEEDCVLVIVACNTASAETLRRLQDEWLEEQYPGRKLLGVIVPMVEEVLDCNARKAVLIATNRTVSSRKYEQLFEEHEDAPQLVSITTPNLAPLIEMGKTEEAFFEAKDIVNEALKAGADSLILGCTHYALLRPLLQDYYQTEPLMIFSPDQIIPKKVLRYLQRHNEITDELSERGTVEMFLSATRPEYQNFMLQLSNKY
jgi:glutamate racemase